MAGSYVDVYFRDLSSDKLFYYRSFYCQCRTIHGFSLRLSRFISNIQTAIVCANGPKTLDFSHMYFSTIVGVFESVNDNPIVFCPGIKINPADQKIYEI